ncbi:hypothetical protein [Rhizobium leguminosarum]|uniref:hypothetical protein n=1 Tax=Rhizobium leguminosarum TaxID=384 RepID=UPI0014418A4A|nr:hypothetical protein [Rhizobium leguminosarum]NKL03778.1 hypothetical protein [Rhizobium leguminosarum bv. viciae]NKL84147.1 hypothetical protein [Rhizobium leguminosarum bv. viciae]NKL88942.1 hypothetical protein [Rhizobium leguminosarum bv. viciae]NKM89940.1 hypothetical protein [Rhizobium leguminosarum bv. viciae]
MAFPLWMIPLFQYNGCMSVLLEQYYEVPSRMNCQWGYAEKTRIGARGDFFGSAAFFSEFRRVPPRRSP